MCTRVRMIFTAFVLDCISYLYSMMYSINLWTLILACGFHFILFQYHSTQSNRNIVIHANFIAESLFIGNLFLKVAKKRSSQTSHCVDCKVSPILYVMNSHFQLSYGFTCNTGKATGLPFRQISRFSLYYSTLRNERLDLVVLCCISSRTKPSQTDIYLVTHDSWNTATVYCSKYMETFKHWEYIFVRTVRFDRQPSNEISSTKFSIYRAGQASVQTLTVVIELPLINHFNNQHILTLHNRICSNWDLSSFKQFNINIEFPYMK